jgi:hypothetical protein
MAQGTTVLSTSRVAKSNIESVVSANALGTTSVNRKKQKRRAKQAAKAAEQAEKQDTPVTNGHDHLAQATRSHTRSLQNLTPSELQNGDADHDAHDQYDPAADDDQYDSDGEAQTFASRGTLSEVNGHIDAPSGKKSKKKKKKNKSQAADSIQSQTLPPPPPPLTASRTVSQSVQRSAGPKDKIWNTSTQEERENIKEFWLSLGEEERKSLVKIEKEAVLRKMKEQQKHSCSCTVCGRKRTAIEEELEVLYDAYYEELEQYANHQHVPENGAPALPPVRRTYPGYPGAYPSVEHRVEDLDEDEDEDEDEEVESEEYSDEEEDDDYSDDGDDLVHGPAADFFNFGNSLTVKGIVWLYMPHLKLLTTFIGGILTVADDLLKNDGKKFIEMMEQLAERRMQREEQAAFRMANVNPHTHNHSYSPPDEDDFEDDEDEYEESAEEEFEEDDEMVCYSNISTFMAIG